MWRFRSSASRERSAWRHPGAGRFQAATTRYNQSLDVPRGETWELDGVTVYGNVTVGPGAVLRIRHGVIHGHLACATSSMVVVDEIELTGRVLVTPDPDPLRRDPAAQAGAVALLDTQVGGDVRCVGTPGSPATLILGAGTSIAGSVLTAHTDTHDHGAAIRVTTWHTDTAQHSLDLTALEDEPALFNAHGIAG